MAEQNQNLHVAKYEVPAKLKTLCFALIGIGLLTFVVGLLKNQDRLWTSYLISFFFFATLGIGGLFWSAINNVANAGWSVSIRRYAEATTSFIPVMLIGSLLILAGLKKLYPWANPEIVHDSAVIAGKAGFLNAGAFATRMVIFGVGCWIFRSIIVGNSLKQDKSGDNNLTFKNVRWSVGFILFYALAFSLFSVDLIMSLLPSWYSTIFGVYCFSGMFQGFLALLAIIIVVMKRSGLVKGYVTVEHQHDVAKYLKGFTVFWAYIAFSQFMLMWYANLPEETIYYIMRSQNGWMSISVALLIFRFIVPFILLLPRGAKRSDSSLVTISVLILVMHFVDIFWMVYPNFNDGQMTFGFWEIGIFAGFAGIFLLGLLTFWAKNGLVALKDPRMHEALNHHVTY